MLRISESTEATSAIFDGVLVEISPDTETFQPRLKEFEEKNHGKRQKL